MQGLQNESQVCQQHNKSLGSHLLLELKDVEQLNVQQELHHVTKLPVWTRRTYKTDHFIFDTYDRPAHR